MSIRRAALGLLFIALASGCRRQHTGGGRPNAQQAFGGPRFVPVGDGKIIRDLTLNVYWLADANLASDPAMRAALHSREINPNGTMTYRAAVAWVDALNHYQGTGYLGHNNWQLPTTPPTDNSCAVAEGNSGNSFGAQRQLH